MAAVFVMASNLAAAAAAAAASSATNQQQRRSSFANGGGGSAASSVKLSARVVRSSSSSTAARAGRKGFTVFSVVTPPASQTSETGGTSISDQELATDASTSNPLIGITPDRVPMVEAAARGEMGDGKFNWEKQWYPVAVIDLLDESKPHPTQLLGVDVVVWKDGDGKWNVFEDKCPHRLAPLSEGRIEAGKKTSTRVTRV